MAIYHLSVKAISRSAGRSATAAIAYRAGEKVTDERTGVVHDYTRRRGIEHTEIFLPENSPAWATDRAKLWNGAELSENRKNSTVAREFEVAIPAELNHAQRVELVREFARELVERHGMAVDVAIHAPGKGGDHRNHHAHILCTTRRLTQDGFTNKTRELDDQKSGEIVNWRQRWADVANRHLENAGHDERIDARSLDAQRVAAIERGDAEQAVKLDRTPTVHLGPNVIQMERRGISTERGEQGREIASRNAQIINLAEARQRIEALKTDIEKPASIRDLVQREVNANLLRSVEAEKAPLKAANDPTPDAIKREWYNETSRQFIRIVDRAKDMQARTVEAMDRQTKHLARHDQARPAEPLGLFGRFKKAAHDKALTAWRGVRTGLEQRWMQLRGRLELIGEYMRKAGPNEPLTRGQRLALQKAAKARPELAASFARVTATEKAARIAAQRAKLQPRQETQNMEQHPIGTQQESIEALKHRMDAKREKADQAELKKLEKAAIHAAALDDHAGAGQTQQQKPDANQTKATTRDRNSNTDKQATKQDRREKLLNKFKEKVKTDRENDRGRGR